MRAREARLMEIANIIAPSSPLSRGFVAQPSAGASAQRHPTPRGRSRSPLPSVVSHFHAYALRVQRDTIAGKGEKDYTE